jgi:hypothetical protein
MSASVSSGAVGEKASGPSRPNIRAAISMLPVPVAVLVEQRAVPAPDVAHSAALPLDLGHLGVVVPSPPVDGHQRRDADAVLPVPALDAGGDGVELLLEGDGASTPSLPT